MRKSTDTHKSLIVFNYKVTVYNRNDIPEDVTYFFQYKNVSKVKPVHIIGFGPAGMFAALRCIELGYKPIKMPRNQYMENPEVKGLFSCGEGGGYAGGIDAAAMDGERCAEAVIKAIFNKK